MQPEISIIIPVFNEEETIGNLLSQLKLRTSTDTCEIVVVDGGSTDNTREIAGDSGATVIRSEKKGRAVQMNTGAGHASAGIYYFLHADTIPPQRFDEYIINSVSRGYQAGCFQLQFDDSHPALAFYAWFTKLATTLVRFGDQSLFVTRPVFEKAGGFDESLIVMEDQEIVREIKKIASFTLIKKPVITSARKYRENGVYRLQAVFFMIWAGYYLGLKQDALTKIYRKFIQ